MVLFLIYIYARIISPKYMLLDVHLNMHSCVRKHVIQYIYKTPSVFCFNLYLFFHLYFYSFMYYKKLVTASVVNCLIIVEYKLHWLFKNTIHTDILYILSSFGKQIFCQEYSFSCRGTVESTSAVLCWKYYTGNSLFKSILPLAGEYVRKQKGKT
jgi:hypothetical protein